MKIQTKTDEEWNKGLSLINKLLHKLGRGNFLQKKISVNTVINRPALCIYIHLPDFILLLSANQLTL